MADVSITGAGAAASVASTDRIPASKAGTACYITPLQIKTYFNLAAVATSGSASDLGTGTLPAAQLPTPGPTTLGGVKSSAAAAHQFAHGVDTTGAVTYAQPAAADVSGLATVATSGSASDLSSGTLDNARLTAMVGASGVADGTAGLIPKPLAGQQGLFLRADATYAAPTAGAAGSNGQLQYNSGGSLAGMTAMSGDGTLNTSTGVITITKTSGTAFATVATSGSASDLGAGTLPAARLPTPTSVALGGVKSSSAAAHQFATGVDTTGAVTYAQPAFSDISGSVAAAQLPSPSASTLGGVESYAAVSHQWINTISTSGVPSSTQPAFSDISGIAAAAQLPTPSASSLGGVQSYAAVSHQWINSISTLGVPSSTQPAFSDISGSVAASQLPNPSASTLGGVESYAAVSHQWINAISTLGVPSSTQPAFSDISGTVTAAQLPPIQYFGSM